VHDPCSRRRCVTIDPLASLPDLTALRDAQTIVRRAFASTPQYRWPLLEARAGARVWVKHENHTPVGAFKVRGGLVYLDRLRASQPEVPGLVSATRGNHGQSLAYAARGLGLPVTIVVPVGNSREKNAAMRALGAEVIETGDDFQAAVEASIALASERGWLRVPSFHLDLVAGVGTWALELLEAAPALSRLYVPIGLGSGLCGALAAQRALGHGAEIVGVSSVHAPAYARSLATGTLTSAAVSTQLADGMAVRTPDATAFDIMRAAGVRVVEVTDAQVAAAMRAFFSDTHNVAEGAGAAGLAALLNDPVRGPGECVGTVLCGGNVDSDLFARVLTGDDGASHVPA
jgi:threonine dehydratase